MANFLRLYSLDFSWKIFPLGRDYRTVVIFSFVYWKYYFLFWLSLLLIWNQLSTNYLFSLSTCFLSLEFYSFTVEYPVLHFFSFILIWIHLASWIYFFVPFIGFRKFLANGSILLLIWPGLLSLQLPRDKVKNTWPHPSPSSTSWPLFYLQGYKNEGNLLRRIPNWELLAEWFHSLAISYEET